MYGSNWFGIQEEALSSGRVFSYSPPLVPFVEDTISFSSLSLWVYLVSLVFLILLVGVAYFAVKKSNYKLSTFWKVSGVLVFVLLVYVSFFVMLLWSTPFSVISEKLREGAFGDSFGTLNALFSGLAFSGVLITLLLQRKDLLEARIQASSQQIESQFYNMLALQQNIVSGFDVKEDGALLSSGRDCFKVWYRFFEDEFEKNKLSENLGLDEAYEVMWLKYQGHLGLYFRSLNSIFRFVSECGHPDSKKFGYIVRSFLSDFELVVLYYNCINQRGRGFKKYASQYALFDNLDVDMLLDVGELDNFDARTFGANVQALHLHCLFKTPFRTDVIYSSRT